MTESLFDLGFGNSVVGITNYCTRPPEQLTQITRIGGTKNPSSEAIAALKPDLIIANQEENTREIVEDLEARGLPVWVTFPKTIRQSMDILWVLVGVYQSKSAAVRLDTLERALDWAEAESASRKSWRYFCPIWQSDTISAPDAPAWWMTFNQDTYMHDLLRLFGGKNIFSTRLRYYPLEADLGLCEPQDSTNKDTRYPRVTYEEVVTADPQAILLPNEPYPYEEEHRLAILQLFAETTAAKEKQITLIDGSFLTWHGTRLGKALTELDSELKFD